MLLTQILPSPILPVRGRLGDGTDDLIDGLVGDDDLEPHLGDEVDLVLGTAVHLGVAALAAEAADLADGDARDADGLEGGLDVVELERLDDGGDELHRVLL